MQGLIEDVVIVTKGTFLSLVMVALVVVAMVAVTGVAKFLFG